MNDTLFCIAGPSGVGKTTVVDLLEKEGYKVISSYTDRPMRYPNETGHHFLTAAEFDRLPPLVAYTEYSGHRYGTTQQQIDENDLYVIDIEGIRTLKNSYRGEKKIKVIALTADDNILRARMFARGDSELAVTQRRTFDEKAFADITKVADYIIDCGCRSAVEVAEVCGTIMRNKEKGD